MVHALPGVKDIWSRLELQKLIADHMVNEINGNCMVRSQLRTLIREEVEQCLSNTAMSNSPPSKPPPLTTDVWRHLREPAGLSGYQVQQVVEKLQSSKKRLDGLLGQAGLLLSLLQQEGQLDEFTKQQAVRLSQSINYLSMETQSSMSQVECQLQSGHPLDTASDH